MDKIAKKRKRQTQNVPVDGSVWQRLITCLPTKEELEARFAGSARGSGVKK